jgi:ribonuclease T1
VSFFGRRVLSPWLCRLKPGIIFAVFAGTCCSLTVAAAPVLGVVQASQLPLEARTTYRLVRSGGPFPYSKDGMVFGNRERELPAKSRGFYREYTVKSPGAQDRGARRIVCGGYAAARPEACYYTEDHYSSFRKIAE